MRVVYVALVTLLIAAGVPLALLVSLVRPRIRRGLRGRLGISLPSRFQGTTVWLHAASAGEVKVALGLAERLRPLLRGGRILLTTNTSAGSDLAAAAGHVASFAPIDHPSIARRFLTAADPAILVVVETEIWPCWLREAARRGIPAVLVNGRVSERAFGRYRLVRPLMAQALSGFSRLLMRTEADARRVGALGAPAGKTRVLGDLKVALAAAPSAGTADALRARYGVGAGDLVLVAGSTDDGEEAIVMEAVARLRRRFPRLHAIVAPRQPSRFDAAFGILCAADPGARRASAITSERGSTVLLDVMGDLAAHYAMADVAFVGGSFTPRGGQSLVEPAMCGCPVTYGPGVTNWEELAGRLERAGGAYRCGTPEDLAARLEELLADPARRARAGAAGRRAMEPFLAVADETVRELVPLLPATPQTS